MIICFIYSAGVFLRATAAIAVVDEVVGGFSSFFFSAVLPSSNLQPSHETNIYIYIYMNQLAAISGHLASSRQCRPILWPRKPDQTSCRRTIWHGNVRTRAATYSNTSHQLWSSCGRTSQTGQPKSRQSTTEAPLRPTNRHPKRGTPCPCKTTRVITNGHEKKDVQM